MLMKKRLLLLPIACLAMVTSCAEEEMPFSTGSSEQQVIQPELDLTFGYNSVITETDSLSSVSIPLNSCVPVLVSCRDGFADLKCVNVDGKYYLQVANPEKAQLGVDKITLTVNGHPELTKSFLFTVNKSIPQTRADVNVDPLLKRFADVFSVGQYLWEYSTSKTPTYPMLNAKALYNPEDPDNNYIAEATQFPAERYTEKFSGSSMQKHSQSIAGSFGIDKIPMGQFLFGFSISGSRKSVSENYYEYLTETEKSQTAKAALTLDLLTIPAHSEEWKKFIHKDLDDALNNQNTNIYKRFTTDDDGACEIIRLFGSHLLTSCVLGCQATLEFHKKQDLSQVATDIALAASLTKKKEKELLPDSLEKWDQVLIAQHLASKRTSGKLDLNFSWSDYIEETECEWHTKLLGGNVNTANDFSDWKPTDDPKNWYPIAYRRDPAEEVFLRAIYEFCQDPNSERCKSLKHVMEDVDDKGFCYFTKYMSEKYGVDLYPKPTEWVVADIYCDVNAGKEDTDHPYPKKKTVNIKGKEKPFTYTLYPFTDLFLNKERCLDTQTNQFGRIGIGGCHYWYYAMAMRDDFPGLADIRLVEEGSVKKFLNDGYYRCINSDMDFGRGWGCWETNNFVLMALPIEVGDQTTTPITGVRLEAWDQENRSNNEVEVLGVTGGTGYDAASGRNKKAIYFEYWNEVWSDNKRADVPDPNYVRDQNNQINAVYHLKCVRQPWYLFLSTIKKPITDNKNYLVLPINMMNRK